MNLAYIKKLGFYIQKIDINTQKIDISSLKIFEIVIVDLQILNKLKKTRFFEETFLIVNIKIKVVFKIFF